MTNAIVIGGGIAGSSTAYALSRRGIAVTIIERHDTLAQEASGNPVAMLYPTLTVKPSAQSHLASIGFKFTLNLLKALPSKEQMYDNCGQIQLALNAHTQARQARLISQEHPTLELVDSVTASEIAGIDLTCGGLYLAEAGWLKPAILCDVLTTHPQIKKMCLTNALRIERLHHQWHVTDAKNNGYAAEIVVICNANDIKQFKQCTSIAITPVRGQVNFFHETTYSQNIRSIICSDHYLSPSIDGYHSIGTSYGPNDMNPYLSSLDTHKNMQALKKISMPLFKSLQTIVPHGRVAWRSATLDYMPLAGQLLDDVAIRANPPRYNSNASHLPWLDGLYVNAGHGSKGMITAPVCGELIAELACNNKPSIDPILTSKLNPSRFLLREFGLKQLAYALY